MFRGLFYKRFKQDKICICGAMPGNAEGKFWGDWHYALSMKREFELRGYQTIILSSEEWYQENDAKWMIILRGKKTFDVDKKQIGKKYILWAISHPSSITAEECNAYDYVFFASNKLHEIFKNIIKPESEVLLQCADTEIMKCVDTFDKKYDLLFIGNSRGVYRKILEDVTPPDYPLTIYGRHWDRFPVSCYVAGRYMPRENVGQAYHDAKIVLNDHWEDMLEYGVVSNRIFDALAAKAFVISDYMPEIEELFGEHVITYTTKEELRFKIRYYMEHDSERAYHACEGYNLVLLNHSFKNRISIIIDRMHNIK